MAERMIVADIIEATDGVRIEDCGNPTRKLLDVEAKYRHKQRERSRLEGEALVRRILYGPTGEMRGVLLDDGTTVALPMDRNGEFAEFLSPASWLTVRGAGWVTEMGTGIEADEIGQSGGAMRVLQH